MPTSSEKEKTSRRRERRLVMLPGVSRQVRACHVPGLRTMEGLSQVASARVIVCAWCAPDSFQQTDTRIRVGVKARLEGLLRHRATEEIALEGVDAHGLEDFGLPPLLDPLDNDLHAE